MLNLSRTLRTTSLSRQARSLSTTTSRFNSDDKKGTHSADHYFKDVDENPPPDSSIHRVDASSEAAQRPHEPPSGKWSQAGTQTSEYENVSREEPYDAAGKEKGEKLSYGGVEDSAGRTGGSNEGPNGKDAGGRQ